ncbi:CAMKK/META protein kinase [Gaeumannomyces tritici R3-111a-1]|uniref:CAMKK/META protein kinase n=1 Tax=Gaeumannomyces tritici (strain R3-111a-1) TaxID=644352 RepID=J3P3Z7_GAET3|nr:CAMKK/META protein kinase [Gaeumannomyces tritici R3-111a-1]EJT74391.1 CAMKK/META protein kinase [Gaeumannomyces tritici R3-111a-1]
MPPSQAMANSGPTVITPQSPGICVDFHGDSNKQESLPRPALGANLSAPAVQQTYQSPMRQHRRTPSQHREIKETLDARTEYASDDSEGRSHPRINQYTIKEEIGRGSFGAVHLAVDQFGNEFAVKEFSKARLRKRAQSNILKGPRHAGQLPRRGAAFPSVIGSRLNDYRSAEAKDALHLIREEVAIMMKLNHPNLVQLIEVLDDPEEDSLYMVLEMCKKGVVMQVGLDQAAKAYPEETCRHWFRDLILGIEYLHAQSIIHRDIKPDNLLLTNEDVLKVVDFGVSEMFEKAGDMRTAKSAGSPAFLPPELCVARHGNVSGTAADIWSMGVSLYCLRYGRIPFDRSTPLEIYEAIKAEPLGLPPDEGDDFVDLMGRIMDKDPARRITMAELREHPWVTKKGCDPLLSAEENCAVIVEPPNDLEVNHAFTRRMSHLLCVMKAISRFKSLLSSRSLPPTPRRVPPVGQQRQEAVQTPRQEENPERRLDSDVDIPRVTELSGADLLRTSAEHAAVLVAERTKLLQNGIKLTDGGKGQAHDPTDTTPLFLGIGTGGRDDFNSDEPPADVVSDSPVAAGFNVYDRAYEEEIERLKTQRDPHTLFLTKLVDEKDQFRRGGDVVEEAASAGNTTEHSSPLTATPESAFSSSTGKFADLVARTMKGAQDKSGP